MINPRTGMPMPGPMPVGPLEGQYNATPAMAQVPGREGIEQRRPIGQRYFGMMKKGGRVKKTGLYKLHKGEHVIPLSRLVKA